MNEEQLAKATGLELFGNNKYFYGPKVYIKHLNEEQKYSMQADIYDGKNIKGCDVYYVYHFWDEELGFLKNKYIQINVCINDVQVIDVEELKATIKNAKNYLTKYEEIK